MAAPDDSARPGRRARRREVPRFALYGEADESPRKPLSIEAEEALHVESIQSRSRRYRWEIDRHLHADRYQVVWLAQGPVQVNLDENDTRHEGPAALVIPPGVVHAFRFSAESQGHVLTLRPSLWLADAALASPAARLFEQPRWLAWPARAPEAARLAGLCEQLLAEFAAPEATGSPVAAWLARAVLWRLAHAARVQAETRGPSRHRQALLARFQALVERRFQAHWPVSRYAEALGVSPEQLNRSAQAEAGCGALALVHRRLALEACRRLVHSTVPVAKLAEALGFDDPAYFSRFFRRHTGVSPRQWREQQG